MSLESDVDWKDSIQSNLILLLVLWHFSQTELYGERQITHVFKLKNKKLTLDYLSRKINWVTNRIATNAEELGQEPEIISQMQL